MGVIVVSIYSGKCDVYDSLVMINDITDFSNVRIYASDNHIIPLRIDSQKDLIPYYPYLVVMMSSIKDEEISVHLSEKSYVDTEEEERLQWRLNQLKKYYRRCKRNHEPYDEKEAIKKICIWDTAEEYETELVNRVKLSGEKATYIGVHIPMFDEMRKKLYDEMISAGYNKFESKLWCFGWRDIDELLKDDENKT